MSETTRTRRPRLVGGVGAAGVLALSGLLVLQTAGEAIGVTRSVAAGTASVGECFSYSYADMTGVWVLDTPAVPCTGPHTAMTLLIAPSRVLTTLPPAGKLTTAQSNALPSLRTDMAACTATVRRHVGTDTSRFNVNLLYQSGPGGEVQMRCDLIMYSPTGKGITTLPADTTDGAAYPWCAVLRKRHVYTVACGTPRSYAMYERGYLNASGSKKWPGAKVAMAKVRRTCAGSRIFSYPGTRARWREGGYYACYR